VPDDRRGRGVSPGAGRGGQARAVMAERPSGVMVE
jgi:hypothetical protein